MDTSTRTIRFTLNGQQVTADVASHHNLIDLLQRLGFFGARESCGQGLCGCCTVLVNGRAVSGCLYLAALVEDAEVVTIEHGDLDPVQEAFIECGAFQCGFCTPGQIMSLTALLAETPAPTDEQILRAVTGNLCRCGAYLNILKAGRRAAELLTEADAAQR